MPCRSGDPSGHGLSAIARPGQGHRHLARFSGSSVISRRGLPRGIVVFRMELSPQLYSRARAPRVKLAGSVLALLRLENCRQVQGRLHQLSITGGLLHLPEPLEEQVTVEIMFHLGSTTVRARAETIFPMWATQGCLQPFRFTELPDHERHKLDTDLQRLLGRLASGKEKPAGGHETRLPPAVPSEVVLYFDRQEDALHLALSLSAVLFSDNLPCTREEAVKLAREISKVSRVTTKGVLQPAHLSEEDQIPFLVQPN